MIRNFATSAPPRVLVVDDETASRLVMADLLAVEGYEIVTAGSGEEALASVRERHPDLILCDVMMPGLSGFDVCRILKEQEPTRYIPLVIVTGHRAGEDRVRGLELGADDYLLKPINGAELLARVRSTLRLGAYRKILAEKKKFETAMAEMSDGLVVLRPNGAVRSANEAAQRLLDLPDGDLSILDLVGHLFRRFVPSVPEAELREPSARHLRFEIERPMPPAPRLVLSAALTQIAGAPGDEPDVVLCIRNVTEEREETRVKDRFLSLISHKLFTPLTVLMGHVDLLSNDSPQNLREAQRQSLDAVERAARDLRDIFDRLLSFADPSQNESRMQPTVEKLSRVAERVTELAHRFSRRKAIMVEIVPLESDPLVIVDPHQMDIVLENLIENSVKFSDKDTVRLRLETAPASARDRVAIALSDDGPGLPPELVEHVFHRFDQVDPDRTGNVEGLGLGLPLVRRIVEKLGGSIHLSSSVGQGTTVTIEMAAAPRLEERSPGAHPGR